MHGFLLGGPTVDIQKNWRPIETAQRFSMAHPKSLQPTLAVTLWPVPNDYGNYGDVDDGGNYSDGGSDIGSDAGGLTLDDDTGSVLVWWW
jgi:hypothetical protein